MLNGTNWNSVRLKIPIDDDIGWRVEFRTMEVQLTPDENAAYSLIIHLIMRIFHETGDLNLYIPITKLRENFNRAHKKDALRIEKFYFRTNILDQGEPIIEELTIY
jgi:glutamate--cysteine ligase catalytic subunit